ncbi:MAG: hypothetical protein EOP85_12230, partial [Verrucomicrobiaceae bacterium]
MKGNSVWLSVMVIEWAFKLNSKAHRDMTTREFQRLMKKLMDLQLHTKGPAECQTVVAWLRRISFQQFPYQQRMTEADIGRQLLLFHEGPAKKMGDDFASLTGISIKDFKLLCLGVVAHSLAEKGHTLSSSWFRNFKSLIEPESVGRFLSLLR